MWFNPRFHKNLGHVTDGFNPTFHKPEITTVNSIDDPIADMIAKKKAESVGNMSNDNVVTGKSVPVQYGEEL